MVIQPFILPHHSKLSAKEKDFYKSRSDFLNNQGVYVYRNGRLMAWGDWFRLIPKGEATKLARVKVDFSNCMDEYWTIDIKKSRAYPPHLVREQIRKIIGNIAEGSVRVIRGKGKRLYDSNPKPIWVRTSGQGVINYSLDRDHPVISAVQKSLEKHEGKKMEEVLSIIEASVPIESIYTDYTINPQDFERVSDVEKDDLLRRLEDMWNILSASQKVSGEDFRETICSVKPFSDYVAVVDEFIEGKCDA